jgi:hypothetical protein
VTLTYLGLEGTLIHTDRVKADPRCLSGKHHLHGMNAQVIAGPDGTSEGPGRTRPEVRPAASGGAPEYARILVRRVSNPRTSVRAFDGSAYGRHRDFVIVGVGSVPLHVGIGGGPVPVQIDTMYDDRVLAQVTD